MHPDGRPARDEQLTVRATEKTEGWQSVVNAH